MEKVGETHSTEQQIDNNGVETIYFSAFKGLASKPRIEPLVLWENEKWLRSYKIIKDWGTDLERTSEITLRILTRSESILRSALEN